MLVQRVLHEGRPRAHVAAEMGISRQCAARWISRYREEGEPGLHDRSSRPHQTPTRTPVEVESRVLAVREDLHRGQDWIGPELGLAARTVSRILRRHRVPYLRELDPVTGTLIRASKTTAIRYERERPGELVHMDVKKIGRIPDGGGWRAHGRAAVNPQRNRDRTHKIGFDYVHSLVDDHSRLAYSEVLPDEKGPPAPRFSTGPRTTSLSGASGISSG
jgi:transposase